MQFTFSDEQQMLADSVARFVENACSFEARCETIFRDGGGSAENWPTFAANGWLGASLPEAAGGFGGGVVETAIISEQLGRALVLDPWVGCGVMSLRLLAADAERAELLRRAIEGVERVALAYSEPDARGLPWLVSTSAVQEGEGWRLDGIKTLVIGGVNADRYIVSARLSGDRDDEENIALFLVPAGAGGLSVTPTPLHDGTVVAEIRLDSVTDAEHLAVTGQSAALDEAVGHGIVALCAELVGGMERAIEITADYLRTRKQFGLTLSTFQSLQHRMADMAAEKELARSMLYAAIASLENDPPHGRRATLSSAKMLITTAARNICGEAIQLHGGIGMTEEYAVGHYFKRAIVADALFGGCSAHEAVVAASIRERIASAA